MSFDAYRAAQVLKAQIESSSISAEPIYASHGTPDGPRVRCPLPSHRGDGDGYNFQIHPDGGWNCYSSCGNGDVFTFLAVLEFGHAPDAPLRGEVFRAAVARAHELLGLDAEGYRPRPPPGSRKAYPPIEDVQALIESAIPYTGDGALLLSGRDRPGIVPPRRLSREDDPLAYHLPKHARIAEDGRPLLRPASFPASWKQGALIPAYDAAGNLATCCFRPDFPGKVRVLWPPKLCASAWFMNRAARELFLRGADRTADKTERDAAAIQGGGVVERAREFGVLLGEGGPAFLAWAIRLAHMPVSCMPGGSVWLPATLARIPFDAPILLDLDPDDAGLKYLRTVLAALRRHTNVRISARLRYAIDHLGYEATKVKAERYLEDLKKARITQPNLRDADEIEGGPDLESWGFVPLSAEERLAISPIDDRPTITVRPDEDRVNAEALATLSNDPDIYQRARKLVCILPASGASSIGIAAVALAVLRERIAASARWLQADKKSGEMQWAHPPGFCVEAIHARGYWPGIRALVGIVHMPALRPDGSVLDRPGYDRATGLYYAPSIPIEAIPEFPSTVDVRGALDLLLEKIQHFPFKGPSDRGSALAAILTPFARPAYDGPASPLFMVDASRRGAGKSVLATGISHLAGGSTRLLGWQRCEADQRKEITTAARDNVSTILLDNIRGEFGNPSLEQALTLTDRLWSDRLLGGNDSWSGPLDAVWLATSNNAELSGDMGRRVCMCRLDPDSALGEDGVDITPFVADVDANLGVMVRAALMILRGWFAAGRPTQPIAAFESFEGWSSVVRQSVMWLASEFGAPVADPEISRQRDLPMTDPTASAHVTLLCELKRFLSVHGKNGEMKAADFVRQLDRDTESATAQGFAEWTDLCDALDALLPDKRSSRSVGRLLASLRDEWVITEHIEHGTRQVRVQGREVKHTYRWSVEERIRARCDRAAQGDGGGAASDGDGGETPGNGHGMGGLHTITHPKPTPLTHPTEPNDSKVLSNKGGLGGLTSLTRVRARGTPEKSVKADPRAPGCEPYPPTHPSATNPNDVNAVDRWVTENKPTHPEKQTHPDEGLDDPGEDAWSPERCAAEEGAARW